MNVLQLWISNYCKAENLVGARNWFATIALICARQQLSAVHQFLAEAGLLRLRPYEVVRSVQEGLRPTTRPLARLRLTAPPLAGDSLSLFAFCHSGSAKKAFHFVSLSAIDSHASRYVRTLASGPTRVVLYL